MSIEIKEMADEDFAKIEKDYLIWVNLAGFNTPADFENQKYHGAEGMMRFGGSFSSNLGRALFNADYINGAKIMRFFKEEVDHHADLHRKFIENRGKGTE